MNEDIALHILSLASSGTLGTRDLVDATGRSPNTVVRYLRELEARRLVRRRVADKIGAGRPRVLCELTEAGVDRVRLGELGLFAKLDRGARIAWGPLRSFAFWDVPFFGWSDLFADRPVDATPFDVVVERNHALYEDAVTADGGRYPNLEALAAWAAKSGDPRFAAAAAVLLKHARIDVARLVRTSARMRAGNRVGFLAAAAGARPVLRSMEPRARRETMLRGPGPIDAATAALARRWNVRNPVALRAIAEMEELYGRTR